MCVAFRWIAVPGLRRRCPVAHAPSRERDAVGPRACRSRPTDVSTSLLLWTLLLHAAATCAMTGLIWFVQIVHYPLFAAVDAGSFTAYHQAHTRLTTFVVAPLMLAELAAAVVIATHAPHLAHGRWLGLALLAVVWAVTFGVSVPSHDVLATDFVADAHATLVAANWIRTVAWTLRAGLALWMVASAVPT